jgi:hypothetical protein
MHDERSQDNVYSNYPWRDGLKEAQWALGAVAM